MCAGREVDRDDDIRGRRLAGRNRRRDDSPEPTEPRVSGRPVAAVDVPTGAVRGGDPGRVGSNAEQVAAVVVGGH
jgi:hypothetical protein